MNETIKKFLERNGVDSQSLDFDGFGIKSDTDINPILERYCIPGKKVKREISIAQILGYSYTYFDLGANLIQNLSHFFDDNGTSYQTRSVGMLTMHREKCIETLKHVSTQDTIYVKECENNKYIITTNGMHRFHVLRFYYLNELSKIDKSDKLAIQKLNEKYTIPVEVQETDYIKTYSYYILKKLIPQIELQSDYNSNYERTGKVVVRIQDKQKILTDEELLDFLRSTINENKEKVANNIDVFKHYEEKLPTFKNFLEEYQIDLFFQGVSI